MNKLVHVATREFASPLFPLNVLSRIGVTCGSGNVVNFKFPVFFQLFLRFLVHSERKNNCKKPDDQAVFTHCPVEKW